MSLFRPQPNGLTRRAFLLGAVALGGVACEHLPIVDTARKSIDLALSGQPDVPISRAEIEKLPYASIRAKMGRSGYVVMVLGRYDGPDLNWISSDSVVLVTRAGRLVKTAELPENLEQTTFLEPDPIATGLHEISGTAPSSRYIDLQPANYFGLRIEATIGFERREAIEIVERRYQTLRFVETCRVELIDWEFENLYWVDPDNGFVWKSLQHATPGLPAVEIEILKPAA